MKRETYPGFSICFTVGKWGGIHAFASRRFISVTLGWVALSVYFRDMDRQINAWCEQLRVQKKGKGA